MAETVRGEGMARVHRVLAVFEEHPHRLDAARTRYNEPPPPYESDLSGSTTRSQSPNPPCEGQQHYQERQTQLVEDHTASQPRNQFEQQVRQERERLWDADPRRKGIRPIATGGSVDRQAYNNVRKSWVKQGIWNIKWNQFVLGRWKHEELTDSESEAEISSLHPLFAQTLQSNPRSATSGSRERHTSNRDHQREGSRPYHQFFSQLSKERERIQDELIDGSGIDAPDINTTAYENVKKTWAERGIWDRSWGILPGMSWKHEKPLEEALTIQLLSSRSRLYMVTMNWEGQSCRFLVPISGLAP